MKKKVVITGWFQHPHSFAFVNLMQINELLKLGWDVYRFDRAPLSVNWLSNDIGFSKDIFYKKILDQLKPATALENYDLAIDIAVPLRPSPFNAKKKIGFLVTEYGTILGVWRAERAMDPGAAQGAAGGEHPGVSSPKTHVSSPV